jgi:hypothetical protein
LAHDPSKVELAFTGEQAMVQQVIKQCRRTECVAGIRQLNLEYLLPRNGSQSGVIPNIPAVSSLNIPPSRASSVNGHIG